MSIESLRQDFDGAVSGAEKLRIMTAIKKERVRLIAGETKNVGQNNEVPVVVMSSSEIDADKNNPHQYRKAAFNLIRSKYGSKPPVPVDAKDGTVVLVGMGGLKHVLKDGTPTWQDSVATLHAEEIITNADYLGSEPDYRNRKEIKAVHRYGATIDIDGENYGVVVVVMEASDGKRYYDHTVTEKDKSPVGLLANPSTDEVSEESGRPFAELSDENIAQQQENSNLEQELSDLIGSSKQVEWTNKIRAEKLERLKLVQVEVDEKQIIDAKIIKLKAETSAKFWIDNRNKGNYDLLDAIEVTEEEIKNPSSIKPIKKPLPKPLEESDLEKLVEKFDKALGKYTLQEMFVNFKNGAKKTIEEGIHTETEVEQAFLKRYELNSVEDIAKFDELRAKKHQLQQSEAIESRLKTAQIISDAISKYGSDIIMENLNDVFLGFKPQIEQAIKGKKKNF